MYGRRGGGGPIGASFAEPPLGRLPLPAGTFLVTSVLDVRTTASEGVAICELSVDGASDTDTMTMFESTGGNLSGGGSEQMTLQLLKTGPATTATLVCQDSPSQPSSWSALRMSAVETTTGTVVPLA